MDLDSEFPVAFNMLIMVFYGEEACAFCLSHCQFLFHNLPCLVANFNQPRQMVETLWKIIEIFIRLCEKSVSEQGRNSCFQQGE